MGVGAVVDNRFDEGRIYSYHNLLVDLHNHIQVTVEQKVEVVLFVS